MMLRFLPSASETQRQAVADALDELDVDSAVEGDALVLSGWLSPDDAAAVAAMPGVSSIEEGPPVRATMREALLSWVASAALVMGVLVVAAALLPAPLGARPDPMQTPADLRPVWPLVPWFTAAERAPPSMLVTLLPLLVVATPFLWPFVARGLAKRWPAAHTVIGVVVVTAHVALLALGLVR